MNGAARHREIAVDLGVLGGALGVVAGMTQTLVGNRIPAWSGNKTSPIGLGLLTVLLSVLAIAGVWGLRGPHPAPPWRRAVALIGLLVPAGLCFSTVGRLWYVPGAILMAAAFRIVSAEGREELWSVVRVNWLWALISVLGAFEVLMAVSAAPASTTAVGVIAGVLLMAAPWATADARVRVALILLGSIPFALLTWWSLATPLLAAVAAGIGLATLRRTPPHGGPTPGRH